MHSVDFLQWCKPYLFVHNTPEMIEDKLWQMTSHNPAAPPATSVV
jgi:hypothetical protein